MKQTRVFPALLLVGLLVWVVNVDFARAESPARMTGQVVCSACWFEASDRKVTPYGTDADVKCAIRCSKGNVPMALAVWEREKVTLYLLEPGDFTPEGGNFSSYVPKTVEVMGTARTEGEKHILHVDDLRVVAQEGGSATTTPAADASAPDLALTDRNGAAQSLGALRGKNVVVLNFWATWCVPCRREMPSFVAIQKEYGAKGVQVIAASVDDPGADAQITKLVNQVGINFPVWIGASPDDMARFGLGAELPGTVVLDYDGNVVTRFRGIVDEAQLKSTLDDLLKKSPNGQS